MGFNGTFVVIRHDAVPADLVAAHGFEPSSGADAAGCGSVHEPSDWVRVDGEWSDGWRVWTYYGQLPPGYPGALMDATSAPILTGYVVGSDATRVEGLGPRTGRWAAWQMVWRAVGYFGMPMAYDDEAYDEDDISDEQAFELNHQAELAEVQRLLADAPGGAATARQAVAWAEEGGLVASADAVLAALDGQRVFAEELFMDLLGSLGIQARLLEPTPR